MSVSASLCIEDHENPLEPRGQTLLGNLLRDYLLFLLHPFARRQKLGMLIGGQNYDFQGNIYAPDVSFIGVQKLHLLDWEKPVQRFAPDLAIDIPSPTDLYRDVLARKHRYLDSGTSDVWLISTITREIALYNRNRIIRGSDDLSTPLIPGFSITVDKLFDEAEA